MERYFTFSGAVKLITLLENVFAPGSTEDIKARMMASDAPIANEKDISNGTSQKEEEMVVSA